MVDYAGRQLFLLTPLREGRPVAVGSSCVAFHKFLLTPLREGRPARITPSPKRTNFYSRPCGRGDQNMVQQFRQFQQFLLTPLREGRPESTRTVVRISPFLLTPLREGRRSRPRTGTDAVFISTHAPAGGATRPHRRMSISARLFLLTPLREGRPVFVFFGGIHPPAISTHAPAGGATPLRSHRRHDAAISTHAPAGGATFEIVAQWSSCFQISTHAPAGGATQI